MKLKLFNKYFFTTASIIVFSLAIMMIILSFVLNNYIAKSRENTLSIACNEVEEFVERGGQRTNSAKLDWRKMLDSFIQEEVSDDSFSPPDRTFTFFKASSPEKSILPKKLLTYVSSGSFEY